MALFPVMSLAILAAVESLLAAGACEESDVGDVTVGTLARTRGHFLKPNRAVVNKLTKNGVN